MDTAGTRAYYATVAPLYDAELAGRDDLRCWRELVDAWRPRRLIDYGCGTGRVAVPLALQCAQWGGETLGLDLSPAMLRLACGRWRHGRGEAPATALRLHLGDMRCASLGRTADLAIFADDPLTHLAGVDDLIATFRRVRDHLRPGGHLVVEAALLPPEARERSHPIVLRRRYRFASPDGWIAVEQQRRIEPARDRALVTYRYTPLDGAGQAREPATEARFTAHYLDLARLEALFRLAGCRMEERWSDFRFHALAVDSGMMLCTGIRE